MYGNRNFIPFFKTTYVAGGGAGLKKYGEWDQDYIADGSGVYITRNQDYKVVFNLNNNIAYDNGINGLVVHKTTHDEVRVNVNYNIIFENGRTTKDKEKRQDAGGLTVNSGGNNIRSTVTL